MKTSVFVAIALFAVVQFIDAYPPPSPPGPTRSRLLGAKQCTWGPSYWCKNITNAAGCRAVKHCIQTVWEHKKLPPDGSSVCQTCLEMVKEARDQLLSNQTEEEIKEVFDGSCDLLEVKIIADECKKVVDEFVPELVDTLASQMDPQVVCQVAGLCNNERYKRLLESSKQLPTAQPVTDVNQQCQGCLTVLHLIDEKFNKLSRDQVLQGMLKVCGQMSSLSDACSNIVLTYFNDIYTHLQENLNSDEFCLMAGECSAQFHKHTTIEITPLSHVGFVDVSKKNDLPCDLCIQLVKHFRDVLIANTTEAEFEQVLKGICKQTRNFKTECLDIVDEYCPVIYKFLSDELNGTVLCGMVGICPGPDLLSDDDDMPIMPLLPVQTVNKLHNEKRGSVPVAKGGASVKVISEHYDLSPEIAQLPIERLMPQTLTMIGNTQLCTFCEYFLHYVQQAITDPKTEEEIKEVVDKACNHLPSSVNETCYEFVDTYGDAFVALLAQEIDPSVICPLLSVCKSDDSKDVDVFIKNKGDKPNCPLCLFAVTKLEEELKANKTEAEIRKELSKLCSHLSKKLKEECDDFVTTYADRIVDSLLADLTPQEVCVYLRLCSESSSVNAHEPHPVIIYGGEILTNEIPDHTANGKTLIAPVGTSSVKQTPGCVICEFVLKELEQVLKDNQTDEEIMNAVRSICTILPKTVNTECTNFVNKYGELVISLLQNQVAPSLVCGIMGLCISGKEQLRNEVQDCAVCQASIITMVQVLENPKVDHDYDHILEKTCRAMPVRYQKKCRDLHRIYGFDIYTKVATLSDTDDICSELGLCHDREKRDVLIGSNKCTWGPSYWCASQEKAVECGATKHCQEKVWGKANSNK